MNRADRTAEAIELLKQVSAHYNVDTETLRGPTRCIEYTAIRRMYCQQGRALGINTVELGIALNRDHTTVVYHTNLALRERKRVNRPPWLTRTERRIQKMEKERHAHHL